MQTLNIMTHTFPRKNIDANQKTYADTRDVQKTEIRFGFGF